MTRPTSTTATPTTATPTTATPTTATPSTSTAGPTGLLGGRPVHRVGYGAMALAEPEPLATGAALALLRAAVDGGLDHVDTAGFYGDQTANALIRAALAPYSDGLALVSKVGARRATDGRLVPAQRPGELRAAVEEDLRHLGAERLAVVNLRRLDRRPGIVATGNDVVDLDDQLAELVALRDAGTVGAIGLSNVDLDQLTRAAPAGVACVQNLYNVLDRSAEPLLAACAAAGAAWVPFFPLGSRSFAPLRVTDHPVVVATAARLGATPAQVGLAWLLARGPHVLLIPGTRDPVHLAENLAAAGVGLDAQALADLDALTPAGTG